MSKIDFFKAEDFGGSADWTSHEIAAFCNKKLERESIKISGRRLGDSELTNQHRSGWVFAEPHVFPPNEYYGDTHQGLMIDLRPIVKDTAEDLVRELAALEMFVTKREDLGERIGNIVMRARALVGSK